MNLRPVCSLTLFIRIEWSVFAVKQTFPVVCSPYEMRDTRYDQTRSYSEGCELHYWLTKASLASLKLHNMIGQQAYERANQQPRPLINHFSCQTITEAARLDFWTNSDNDHFFSHSCLYLFDALSTTRLIYVRGFPRMCSV